MMRSSTRAASALLMAGASAILVLCAPADARGTAGPGWTVQPTPKSGVEFGDLWSVACPSRTTCIAVGSSFASDPSVTSPLIERWNGRAWKIQRTPPIRPKIGELLGLSCTSTVACTAVGDNSDAGGDTFPLVERWNGTRWSVQPAPRPSSEGSLDDASLGAVSCTSRSACTSVGADDDASVPLAERWNGLRWSIEPTPPSTEDGGSLIGVSCTSPTACTAVGQDIDLVCDTLTERWNGERWSREPNADLSECGQGDNVGFDDVWCAPGDSCVAVGTYQPAAGLGYPLPLIEREADRSWVGEPTPGVDYLVDPWGGGGYLGGLTCTSITACIAVGGAWSELAQVPIVERLSGTQWTLQRIAPLNGELVEISCTAPNACTAVGHSDPNGVDVPLVERLSDPEP